MHPMQLQGATPLRQLPHAAASPTLGPPRGAAGINDESAVLRPLPLQALRHRRFYCRRLLPRRLLPCFAHGLSLNHVHICTERLQGAKGTRGDECQMSTRAGPSPRLAQHLVFVAAAALR